MGGILYLPPIVVYSQTTIYYFLAFKLAFAR